MENMSQRVKTMPQTIEDEGVGNPRSLKNKKPCHRCAFVGNGMDSFPVNGKQVGNPRNWESKNCVVSVL